MKKEVKKTDVETNEKSRLENDTIDMPELESEESAVQKRNRLGKASLVDNQFL